MDVFASHFDRMAEPSRGDERLAVAGGGKASHTVTLRRGSSEADHEKIMLAPEGIGWLLYGVESTGYSHRASLGARKNGTENSGRSVRGIEGIGWIGSGMDTFTRGNAGSFWIGGIGNDRARHCLQRIGDAGLGEHWQGLDTSRRETGEAFGPYGASSGLAGTGRDSWDRASSRARNGAKLYEN